MTVAVSPQLSYDDARLREVCERFGVVWLALFGSVVRGEAQAESDIDLLYQLEPDRVFTYYDLYDLAEALGEVFGGRNVDLGKPGQLHWFIRKRVLAEAKQLYAR